MLPISIIIPCYNSAPTLPRALDSAIAQREAAQILVVDDGSTDKTAEIVFRYARLDARVHLLQMASNSGAASARNWGALHATAPVVAFLDADDEYLPGALTAASAWLEKSPHDAVVRLDVEFFGFPESVLAHPDFAQKAAALSNTVPSSLVIRRCAFLALGGFPMDDFFRQYGGEDGALAWALHETFGQHRLDDAKRVRMHYHTGIHAERFFRIQTGLDTPDPGDNAAVIQFSRQFLDQAIGVVKQLRGLNVGAALDQAGRLSAGESAYEPVTDIVIPAISDDAG
ncbi:glycosyltransferase family 2 protein [Paraburkholderia adhaesiva]|uniref:glycosyltransferase family 2 protein n=1 Tax=Paraburkholderia adhaesiva TaxID=2883244 RepID=UPI001F344845|nr:glycosyltransferase family A protein [Paraburkholderia adhaesiva]